MSLPAPATVPSVPRKAMVQVTLQALGSLLGLPPGVRVIQWQFDMATQTFTYLLEGQTLPVRFGVPEGSPIRMTTLGYNTPAPQATFFN